MAVIQAITNPMIAFANWFWGIPILILIGGGGLFMCIYLGFPQLRHAHYINGQTFGKMFGKSDTTEGTVSPFAAACTALASSIGASNIVGVPVAIALGGPGAVFWIWILAIIGMCTKYVEVTLGIKYREKNEVGEMVGGPYYYCRKGLGELGEGWKKVGAFFGIWYAFFLMIELFPSIASQSASATSQFVVFGIDEKIVAVIVAVIVAIVCIGGVKRIASVCDKLVPFMALIYLIGGIILILMNITNVPAAIAMIFADAFKGHAAVGGFAGAGAAMAIRWGAARGVYSNEAGMGTAPQGHAAANVDHPIRQGMWGVFEVMVDTIIVCTITALAVLVTGAWTTENASTTASGSLAQRAYASAFGSGFANVFIAICVFLFVLSTIIVITFYGQRQSEFLFGVKFSKIWVWVYIVAIIVGGMGIQLGTLYSLTDFFLGIIVIPNMITIIILVPQVKKLQTEFFHTPGKYYLADVEEKKAKKAAKAK
ncbi:MAG: alanine/glycine:cation symporter family protein [Anaerovoracaceae bacterium]